MFQTYCKGWDVMLIAYYMNGNFIDEKKFIHQVQYAVAVIYLIPVVYIARVINLSFITQVMLYQTLNARTTFDTIPCFDTFISTKKSIILTLINARLFPTFDIVEIHMTSQNSFSVDAKITSIF